MSDTVFILGAGFSKVAGIPLLGGFVERMWDMSVRGRTDKPLEPDDREALTQAMKIRGELDGYHGRAQFDDRNIEDVLSILSFNVLAGAKRDRQKLTAMTNAIVRTIEICCTVKHPGIEPRKGTRFQQSSPSTTTLCSKDHCFKSWLAQSTAHEFSFLSITWL